MKRLFLFTLIIFLSFALFSQGCLPVGITFATQEQIDNFQADYPGCTEIEGYINIGTGGIESDISNLNGLNVLTSIGGNVIIINNDSLTTLTGLDNLNTIGGELQIYRNDGLFSLTGLEGLDSIGGSLKIYGNYGMINLNGLEGITYIGEHVFISLNWNLVSLTGLEGLTTFGGDCYIQYNRVLTSLDGFYGLTSIGGDLFIFMNDSLATLTGLEGLTSIGGFLEIRKNNILESIEGLENIDPSTIEYIYIRNNPSLSTCDIDNVCAYLSSPIGEITIENNSSGCNSQQEVEEACETVSIQEVSSIQYIATSPNPFTTSITFSYTLKQTSTVQLSIYNQVGQSVYQHTEKQPQGEQQLQWDARGLAEGIYYYRLKVGDAVANGKVIKTK